MDTSRGIPVNFNTYFIVSILAHVHLIILILYSQTFCPYTSAHKNFSHNNNFALRRFWIYRAHQKVISFLYFKLFYDSLTLNIHNHKWTISMKQGQLSSKSWCLLTFFRGLNYFKRWIHLIHFLEVWIILQGEFT